MSIENKLSELMTERGISNRISMRDKRHTWVIHFVLNHEIHTITPESLLCDQDWMDLPVFE